MKTITKIFNTKIRTGLMVLASLFAILIASCKKDAEEVKVSVSPTLTMSVNTLVLDRAKADQPAIVFSWSKAQVSGLQGALTYFLQWDLKGNNFANPANIKIGRDSVMKAYTVAALNNLVGTLPTGIASQIEMRVVTATSDGSLAPFYSNVALLTVTPYAKTIPPPYTQLWLVGDATPAGWNIDSPTPMVEDGTDPFIFTWTGNLTAGEFKIATAKSWDAAFYRPVANHPALTDHQAQLSAGDPDNKWQISKASKYKITLNLHTLTVSIVDLDSGIAPPYTQLWVVGDATPAGWNIDAPTPLVKDATDPFIFTYTGALTAGEFKFPVATGDWNAKFYRPSTNHPALTNNQVLLSAGDPDNKWQITDAGNYKITLDIRELTVTIVKL